MLTARCVVRRLELVLVLVLATTTAIIGWLHSVTAAARAASVGRCDPHKEYHHTNHQHSQRQGKSTPRRDHGLGSYPSTTTMGPGAEGGIGCLLPYLDVD